MFKNPPECDRPTECRFVSLGGATTLLAWHPTYDRAGNRLGGSDPNVSTWHYSCQTCGKSWTETSQALDTPSQITPNQAGS